MWSEEQMEGMPPDQWILWGKRGRPLVTNGQNGYNISEVSGRTPAGPVYAVSAPVQALPYIVTIERKIIP